MRSESSDSSPGIASLLGAITSALIFSLVVNEVVPAPHVPAPIEAIVQILAGLLPVLAIMLVAIPAVAVLLVFVSVAAGAISTLVEYPVTTVGTVRSVDRDECSADGSAGATECLTCGATAQEYVTTSWRRHRVWFGVPIETVAEGQHVDCRACASDPIVANARAAADDPDSVPALTDASEPPVPLDELDDGDLDEILAKHEADPEDNIDDAIAEVAG